MATNLSRAATVSAASGYQRRRGSFTADWTDSHSLSKHSFDKRVSRDDLALILKSSKKGNVTAFHIPIHGRLPSPEHSPRTSSLTRTTWVRTSTPDSMIDSGETGVIAVGMAIGSPTQMGDFAPAPWNPQNRAMNAVVDIPEPMPEPVSEPVDDTQQKARKWGLFRSKSKRATRPEKPQRSMTESVNTSTTSLGSSGMPTSAPADQSSRKMPKHKPIVIRSQTEPIISEPAQMIAEVPRSVPTSAEVKPISPGKLTKEKPALQRKASKESKLKDPGSGGIGRKMSLRGLRGDSSKKRSEKAIAPPPSSPPPMPPMPPMPAIPHSLLDVEIPSIKMDRYSVMFNSVLQPPQGSASSLLARRQATLDHLKSVKDAIAENRDESLRPRRATSPQPSPTFVSQNHSKPLPSPRFRANTSPALLDSSYYHSEESPEAVTPRVAQVSRSESQHNKFAAQATHYQPALVSKFNRRPSAASTDKISVTSAKQTSPPVPIISPNTHSKHSSPFTPSPGTVPESPEHTDDEKDVQVAKGRLSSPSEPSWHMVSPPASITSSGAETSRRFSPSSSLASPKKQAPEADAQEALRNAVEISIARQISVSHQQRKMLHPLKSNPSLRHRGNGSPSGPGYIAIEKDERLAETKSSTPTLVHPRELTHSPDAYQMHRKSERVILEES